MISIGFGPIWGEGGGLLLALTLMISVLYNQSLCEKFSVKEGLLMGVCFGGGEEISRLHSACAIESINVELLPCMSPLVW